MRHPNPALARFIDGLEAVVDRERDQWKIVAEVESLMKRLAGEAGIAVSRRTVNEVRRLLTAPGR